MRLATWELVETVIVCVDPRLASAIFISAAGAGGGLLI
jgi:hypothetical protein